MYGPPGTGKTLLARACAAQTNATFLKLAGPQLVQMFIGDGAKLVRDCFALAKEKAPSIIFIDELDAVGTKRFDSEKSGDREVQRTMLELLNQLDGFASDDRELGWIGPQHGRVRRSHAQGRLRRGWYDCVEERYEQGQPRALRRCYCGGTIEEKGYKHGNIRVIYFLSQILSCLFS